MWHLAVQQPVWVLSKQVCVTSKRPFSYQDDQKQQPSKPAGCFLGGSQLFSMMALQPVTCTVYPTLFTFPRTTTHFTLWLQCPSTALICSLAFFLLEESSSCSLAANLLLCDFLFTWNDVAACLCPVSCSFIITFLAFCPLALHYCYFYSESYNFSFTELFVAFCCLLCNSCNEYSFLMASLSCLPVLPFPRLSQLMKICF